jgi:hypothetical protein
MKLEELLKTWTLEGLKASDLMEAEFFELNELNIDPLNTYKYKRLKDPNYTESYSFEDRCGNTIVAVYLSEDYEFKTGYKVPGVQGLIFRPENLAGSENRINPCPDDKRVGTVYKILTQEILPKYLLNKKPSKLFFNPVSPSRKRLVSMIIGKILKDHPELTSKSGYLVNI